MLIRQSPTPFMEFYKRGDLYPQSFTFDCALGGLMGYTQAVLVKPLAIR
jgi:hypothetical protein